MRKKINFRKISRQGFDSPRLHYKFKKENIILMAKGWKNFKNFKEENKTRANRIKEDNDLKNLIRTTKSLSVKDLKDQNAELYKQKKLREDSLVSALDKNILKSEKLITEAKKIKALREMENCDK